MEIWRVTRREARCPLVTGLWSILSQLFSDSAAPLTLSTSHFVKAKLCEKNCNTAVFKRAPQTFAHPEHFVAPNVFVCKSGINSGFDEKRTYKLSLAVCCCLHCVLVFNSFIIKGFSLAAPCWTLSCNGGINWSTEVSAYNYVLSAAHYFTHIQTHAHTHTHTAVQTEYECRRACTVYTHTDKCMYPGAQLWKLILSLKDLETLCPEQFLCNSAQFNDFSAVSSSVITHVSPPTQIN